MIALVTGGSSGIGNAICKKLLSDGHQVVNVSRRRECKDASVPSGATFIQCDVRSTSSLIAIVDRFRPDILVNNVGILPLGDFLLQIEEEFDDLIRINLKSYVFATQAAIKHMISSSCGNIINISSVNGIHASPDTPVYGATKAAIINFTMSIAAEYGRFGIRCNCVSPGSIQTQLVPSDEEFPKKQLDMIPVGRQGFPHEVAEVVSWLTNSSYVNGANVVVDGGKYCGAWRW